MGLRTLGLAMALVVGCGAPSVPPEQLTNQTVEAGCGMCQYGIVGNQGCYWSIRWKGETLVVQGEIPADHENHAPDGMCNMKRQATVSGRAKGGQFYSKKFELLEARAVPQTPEYTPADKH